MTTTVRVADLVTENPARVRALQDAGIDYCCGGQNSLADACRRRGGPRRRGRRAGRIDRPPAMPSWAGLGITALVEHLVDTHHAYLRAELPGLVNLGEKVAAAHRPSHPELPAVLETLRTLWADLEPHLAKEEQVLFPWCRRLEDGHTDAGWLAAPVECMRYEHEAAGALLDDLRRLTGEFTVPDDACASCRAFLAGLAALDEDTRLHIHKENNVLFPAVLARLGE